MSGTAGASASQPGVDGSSPSTGSAGTTGAAGTSAPADAGAVDGGGAQCAVAIVSLIPGSFSGLQSGPLSVLRVQASVTGYAGVPAWVWSVRLAGGSSLADVAFTTVGAAGDTIDIKLEAPGGYEIQAHVDGAPQCDRSPLIVTVDPPRTPSFLFRVTPPSGSRLPMRESTILASEVTAGTHTIDLGDDAAPTVSLLPTDPRGFPLPSYVVLTSSSSALNLQTYTASGPLVASLVSDQTYNVLVVPDGGWAPLLVTGTPDVLGQNLQITAGVSVTGTSLDGNGQPVENARVILRDGLLPSTVGVTDGAGAFAVSARAGVFSAVISPPAGAGLNEAHVAASPGITLGDASLTLDMQWTAIAAAPLEVTVHDAGDAVVAGAQVRAESSAEVASVGTLRVRSGASNAIDLPVTGSARADGVTDANGVASLGLLPVGTYHLTVAPPASMSAAITASEVALPAAGSASDVTLAATVVQSGTLTPAAKTAGARVTALDDGALAPAASPSALADANGQFTLALSPGRTYELLVEPVPGSGLASDVLAVFSPGLSPSARMDAVPVALTWHGSVAGAGRPVAGAVVQVFCVGPSDTCLDPSVVVAQGTTGPDGTLSLIVPNPN